MELEITFRSSSFGKTSRYSDKNSGAVLTLKTLKTLNLGTHSGALEGGGSLSAVVTCGIRLGFSLSEGLGRDLECQEEGTEHYANRSILHFGLLWVVQHASTDRL